MANEQLAKAERVARQGIAAETGPEKEVAIQYLMQRIWDLEKELATTRQATALVIYTVARNAPDKPPGDPDGGVVIMTDKSIAALGPLLEMSIDRNEKDKITIIRVNRKDPAERKKG